MRLSDCREINTMQLITGRWGVVFNGNKTYAKFDTEEEADQCITVLAMDLRKEREKEKRYGNR
ncbi:MAG: hypothetical protein HXM41_07865 [Lachnospiraceae bacterium]|jgi:hypothetical protein|nr:hypothetical protein [Lachnospiraceae bacterium]